MDEQCKSRQRWLFYAYDRIRRTVGERTLAALERLLSLLSAFVTDGWPLYESRLKGKLHVIQRIERHNLNLRQHLARLGFSKSVELHDKVIGHYLNIIGVITRALREK